MSYKVLYRKYRPDNFDDVIGQKYVVEILKNSIKEGHIAHAYFQAQGELEKLQWLEY